MRDPATGEEFAVKSGNSKAHAENEISMNNAYLAAGIQALPVKEYVEGGTTYQVAPWLPGQQIRGYAVQGSREQREFAGGFAADCLLQNWDVIQNDNTFVLTGGQVCRMDNGGGMSLSAQGIDKNQRAKQQGRSDDWTAYPHDLWSMRDPGITSGGNQLYAGLTWSDITAQMADLVSRGPAIQAAIKSPKDRDVVGKRLRVMKHLVDLSTKALAAGQPPHQVDQAMRAEVQRLESQKVIP